MTDISSKPINLFIAGKRASYKSIARDRGGEEWKKYIENNPRCKKEAEEYLSQHLGEYIDASAIRRLAGIDPTELSKWKKEGLLMGIKFKGKWYYSKSNVVKAINNKNIKI
jgi:hypothetical protein